MLVKAFPRLASNPGPTAMMAAPTIAARTAYSTAVMPRSSRFKMAIVLRKLFIVWSFSFSKPGLFHRRAPGRRGENSAHKHHHSAAHARYPQIENAELHPQRTQQRVERRIEQGEKRLDGVVDKAGDHTQRADHSAQIQRIGAEREGIEKSTRKRRPHARADEFGLVVRQRWRADGGAGAFAREDARCLGPAADRSEEHTSEPQSLMRLAYA